LAIAKAIFFAVSSEIAEEVNAWAAASIPSVVANAWEVNKEALSATVFET